jgi:hypothetical protein
MASGVTAFDARPFLALVAEHSALTLAVAAVLFVVPTAVYLALGKD